MPPRIPSLLHSTIYVVCVCQHPADCHSKIYCKCNENPLQSALANPAKYVGFYEVDKDDGKLFKSQAQPWNVWVNPASNSGKVAEDKTQKVHKGMIWLERDPIKNG